MSGQGPTCPVCGAAVHPARVLVDIDGGMVGRGDRYAHLTWSEMRTFNAMWRVRPHVVSRERLLFATAKPGRDDDREIKVVDVWVSRLRTKLRPLGLNIENAFSEGYRVIDLQQPAQRAA